MAPIRTPLSAIPSGMQITIKYQYIYLNPENNSLELYKRIKKWIERYHNRNNQGINKMKPNITDYNAA